MGTGLVLGAGGMVGRAFHLAVLTALREELGWEAQQAEVVVGTSVGSLLGACIRSGASLDDLVCEATLGDLRSVGSTLAEIGPAPRPPAPVLDFGSPPLSLRELAARARDDIPLRWTTAVCCLIPRGRGSTDEHAAWVDRLVDARWPEQPLWVCAVEMPCMHRVVWGRCPEQDPAIGDAVAASCAIPGYLAPRMHHGREFVDGGIHSPTNADVLVGQGLDRVIISSPMSAVGGCGLNPPDRVRRRFRHRLLHDEASALRRDGTTVVTIEPTVEDLDAMRSHRIHEPLPDGLIERLHASVRRRVRQGEFDGWHERPRYGSTARERRDGVRGPAPVSAWDPRTTRAACRPPRRSDPPEQDEAPG